MAITQINDQLGLTRSAAMSPGELLSYLRRMLQGCVILWVSYPTAVTAGRHLLGHLLNIAALLSAGHLLQEYVRTSPRWIK